MFFQLVKNKYTFFLYSSTTKFVFVLIVQSIASVHLELQRNKFFFNDICKYFKQIDLYCFYFKFFLYLSTTKFVFVLIVQSIASVHLELQRNKFFFNDICKYFKQIDLYCFYFAWQCSLFIIKIIILFLIFMNNALLVNYFCSYYVLLFLIFAQMFLFVPDLTNLTFLC